MELVIDYLLKSCSRKTGSSQKMPTSPMGTAPFSLPLLIPIRRTHQSQRCSWAEPNFIEGDIFRIIVPLSEAATVTVGPTSVSSTTQDSTAVTTQVKLRKAQLDTLVNYCSIPKSRK